MHKTLSPKIQSNLTRLSLALLFSAFCLTGCGKPNFEPVEIAAEDMCAFCKMAISEKRYAAELLNHDGDVFKFDDIGCLANYVAEKQVGDSVAAYYIVDFDSNQWLKAEEASIVASPNFSTPMGGGMAAFKDSSRAETAAAANQGGLLSFAEALSRGKK